MNRDVVAQRYASALLAVAQERDKLDAIGKQTADVAAAVAGSKELAAFLFHPVVRAEDKKEVVAKLFKGKVDELLVDFLQLVIDKGRIDRIGAISAAFQDLLDEAKGCQKAQVETAFPLTDAVKNKLSVKLFSLTGKEILLTEKVSPELIGGIRVQIGDRVVDGSVLNEIRRLKENMLEAPV